MDSKSDEQKKTKEVTLRMAFNNNLTNITGNKTSETTASFMNNKFAELLENDNYIKELVETQDSEITQNKNNLTQILATIAEMQEAIANLGGSVTPPVNPPASSNGKIEKVCLYYGYPICLDEPNTNWDIDAVCEVYGQYDVVVFGDSYQNPEQEVYSETCQIVAKLRNDYPNIKLAGYVPLGLDESWADSNLSIEQVKARIDQWYNITGMNGIFLDEFGFDYSVSRTRQNEAVDYVHSKGMFVVANSWEQRYVFSTENLYLDWLGFHGNPTNAPTHLTSNDYSLLEHQFYKPAIVSHNFSVDVAECSSPNRVKDAYEYYHKNQSDLGGNKTWFEEYGVKLMTLDGLPKELDKKTSDTTAVQKQRIGVKKKELMTRSIIGSIALGIPAIAIGDDEWGASGHYDNWTYPTNITDNATQSEITTVTKVGTDDVEFIKSYSRTVDGKVYTIEIDLPSYRYGEAENTNVDAFEGIRVLIDDEEVTDLWA